jgi:hypothetical protein
VPGGIMAMIVDVPALCAPAFVGGVDERRRRRCLMPAV